MILIEGAPERRGIALHDGTRRASRHSAHELIVATTFPLKPRRLAETIRWY